MTTDLGSLPWRRALWAASQGPGAGYALGPTFFAVMTRDTVPPRPTPLSASAHTPFRLGVRVHALIAFIKNMASTGIVTSR